MKLAAGGRDGGRYFLCVSRVRIVRIFQTLLPRQISFYSCKYGRKLIKFNRYEFYTEDNIV